MQMRKQRLSISFCLWNILTSQKKWLKKKSNPDRLSPETLPLNSEEANFCIVPIWLIEFWVSWNFLVYWTSNFVQINFHTNKKFYKEVKAINNGSLSCSKNKRYFSFFSQGLGVEAEINLVQPDLKKGRDIWRKRERKIEVWKKRENF